MTSPNLIETHKGASDAQLIVISRNSRPKYTLLFFLAIFMTSSVPLGLYFSSCFTASATSKAIASLYENRHYSVLQDEKVAATIGNLGRVGTFDRQPGASVDQPQPQEPGLTSTAKSTAPNKQKIASMSGANPNRSDTDSHFIMPSTGRLTSSYGMRWGKLHAGIDIAAPIGTPVVAVKNGIVIAAGMNAVGHGYGNGIDIRHQDGSISRYAHAEKILVRVGQPVKQGEQIMLMGCTGHCTGPHLHFEIHVADKPVNPRPYLP